MNNITVWGTGYVGTVCGAGFANNGWNVLFYDTNSEILRKLESGETNIYEPGLDTLLSLNRDKLSTSINFNTALNYADVHLICIGTPSDVNGAADLVNLKQCVEQIILKSLTPPNIIIKSTVPVGTSNHFLDFANKNNKKIKIFSNPEFLREGSAVYDFINGDRVVVGGNTLDQKSRELFYNLYSNYPKNNILFTDICSSEIIKYASNAMLASRISFINEIARLSHTVGGNISDIAYGIGLDKRIGLDFLKAGIGYGGSCFPKDVLALIEQFKNFSIDCDLVKSIHVSNEKQYHIYIEQIIEIAKKHKTIGILGLAFKKNTDDLRMSPALKTIDDLILNNITNIHVYDEIISAGNKYNLISQPVQKYSSMNEVLSKCDFIILGNDQDSNLSINFEKYKTEIIFDYRNIVKSKKFNSLGKRIKVIKFGEHD